MSAHAKIQSPMLRRLESALSDRGPSALATFWAGVSRTGTPMVERPRNAPRERLITFVWRGRPGTKRVTLRSLVAHQGGDDELVRLRRSDVWYRTYTVPHDLRETYLFAVDDPPGRTPDDDKEYNVWAHRWKRDPFNPKTFHFTPDPKFRKDPMSGYDLTSSLIELEGAPHHRETLRRGKIAQGTLSLHHFQSRHLHDERRIWLYLPAGFRPDLRNVHLAIFFDGFWYAKPFPTTTILENLAAEKRIVPVVGVFVDSRAGTKERMRDLCRRSPAFGRFLVQELLPWVERTVGIHPKANRVALIGLSCGGLAALHWAIKYPNRFRLVLSQSGWFLARDPLRHEPGAFLEELMQTPTLPLRIYMEAGTDEKHYGVQAGTTLLGINRHLRDVLRLKGYDLMYREFSGGHGDVSWQQTLVDGLEHLFSVRGSVGG